MSEKLGATPTWEQAHHANLPELKHDELHLWWLPLSLAPSQEQDALNLLSDIQRDKYVRRRTPDLQHAYLASRYYLLTLLGAYTGVDASDVLLSYSRLNKPYLSDNQLDLQFNFTDTRGRDRHYGVFVFSRGLEVGTDIESRTRSSNFDAIAEHRFTAKERSYVSQDGTINPEKCLAIWTRKEAFGKATGQGINFKMNEQELINPGKTDLDFFDHQDNPWRLMQFELGDEFIACVVHQGHHRLALRSFHTLEI